MTRIFSWAAGAGLSLALAVPALAQAPGARPANTDATIEDRVEYVLATDADVAKYDIKVDVAQGVVTLGGDVATAAQKAEAERLAKVNGVTRVTNNIAVDANVDRTLAERAKSGLSKTGEAINDAWITTKVKWFFVGEDALRNSNINVDTNNHVVTLKGTVATAAGRARANELAKSTEGVKSVVDQLTIGPAR